MKLLVDFAFVAVTGLFTATLMIGLVKLAVWTTLP